MEITSRGLLSDFIFHEFEGEITDHGDCISVLTPTNLDYFFGNFLLFANPPQVGDCDDWISRFEEVFAKHSGVRHHTFQWLPTTAADPEALEEFRKAGFTIDETSVLAATKVQTDRKAPDGVTFREVETDAEWLAVVDAQTRDGFPQIPMDEYRRYKEVTFAQYRRMKAKGLGGWWGAFKGEELVADMGLFFGDNVGRFQSVETAPQHRRQGICTALVHHVSQQGFAKHPTATLILHAEAGEIAREIYRSVGYEEIETLQAAYRAPRT